MSSDVIRNEVSKHMVLCNCVAHAAGMGHIPGHSLPHSGIAKGLYKRRKKKDLEQ